MGKKKRKTRQQKIITQLKRELTWEKRQRTSTLKKRQVFDKNSEKEEKKGAEYSLNLAGVDLKSDDKKGAKRRAKSHSRIYTYDLSLVRRDLTKTLALTMLALCVEILIYFLIERKGITIFNF